METERIAKLEAQVESIKDDVREVKEDIKEVHSRITTGNRELADKIDTLDKTIETRMAKSAEAAKQQHEEIQKNLQVDINKVTERVDILERWRFMIVGGAVAIGYIIAHFELFSKVFGVK
jgi:ElaB/YqjD/DUF883 family membrane-anchored ribosome-binding protein